MMDCDRIRARIDFYLDDELRGAELVDFANHLERCPACRAIVNGERGFLENIRGVQPLYEAPPVLQERVSRIISEGPDNRHSTSLSRRFRMTVRQAASATFALTSHRPRIAMSITVALILVSAGVWYSTAKKAVVGTHVNPPSSFAIMAVETHLRHLRGQLPFEITTDSPEQISRWFAGKVNFRLELPNYQESSGQDPLYRLEGGRLVGLENDYAAYVGYRMGSRRFCLVATSASVAHPAGGEEIISKGMTFHYDSLNGLKVITWSDRGLTYALVSDLEERGQQSCIVCHQGTRDRDFIEGLKP